MIRHKAIEQSGNRSRKLNLTRIFATAALLITLTSAASNAADATGTVLITGANRGIGLELARQYSADGWQVIGTARRPDAADDLGDLDVTVMQLDVTDQASVEQLAEDLDGQSIDVLINNAGILSMVRSISEIDFEEFDRVMAVNTVGPIRVTQALLPNLRAGKMKKIINTSSVAGSISGKTRGGPYGYSESKAALNMFTRSLAGELKTDGFICIVIHPGWVQTDMGGANAAVTVADSASGIRSVIENLTAEDSGEFRTFEGQQLPW
jgi:NAD(P)-dependent dehydrogenase (short-subunit alcohol dehydrogenase family)